MLLNKWTNKLIDLRSITSLKVIFIICLPLFCQLLDIVIYVTSMNKTLWWIRDVDTYLLAGPSHQQKFLVLRSLQFT